MYQPILICHLEGTLLSLDSIEEYWIPIDWPRLEMSIRCKILKSIDF